VTAAGAGRKLLDAIATRDFDRIRGCFAADAAFAVLTPHRLRTHATAGEAAERYRFWLERLEEYELLDGDVEEIADRVRVRYRFSGRDPEKGWQVNEHTGYGTVAGDCFLTLNVTCTGFRPAQSP
jgi:hypothetical protein